ncbi:MAG: multiple sugar transport system permease protein [Epulopiscium sp.]|jgi:multiple sugar transport system permease protein|nr:transporter permease [Clostridia bacterium]MDK2788782.1 multiple sugar transport system permease protein [Candidatus Epulonipiscium sp.]
MAKVLKMNSRTKIVLINIVALLICAVFLFPLYWIVISSLKSDAEIFKTPQTLFPSEIYFDSYISQFIGPNSALRPFINSSIVAISSMILSLLLGIPAAYGLARFKIRGKKFIILTFLTTQMLPVSLVLTPLFLIYSKLGFLNSYISPILSCSTIAIPFIVLILRPYFLSCPKELEDAAKIDGCRIFSAFIRIMLPISYPGVVTAAAFAFLFAWNDLIYSMTFNNAEVMRPATAGIYHFMNKYGTQWNKIMAYGVLLVLPVILIFIFLQRYIISGLTNGAMKG